MAGGYRKKKSDIAFRSSGQKKKRKTPVAPDNSKGFSGGVPNSSDVVQSSPERSISSMAVNSTEPSVPGTVEEVKQNSKEDPIVTERNFKGEISTAADPQIGSAHSGNPPMNGKLDKRPRTTKPRATASASSKVAFNLPNNPANNHVNTEGLNLPAFSRAVQNALAQAGHASVC